MIGTILYPRPTPCQWTCTCSDYWCSIPWFTNDIILLNQLNTKYAIVIVVVLAPETIVL